MATLLSKPVTRKVVLEKKPHARVSETLIVTLYPDGRIGIRENRRREEFYVHIGPVYLMAVQNEVVAKKAAANPGRKTARSRLPM